MSRIVQAFVTDVKHRFGGLPFGTTGPRMPRQPVV
jgi:hypothetical protein